MANLSVDAPDVAGQDAMSGTTPEEHEIIVGADLSGWSQRLWRKASAITGCFRGQDGRKGTSLALTRPPPFLHRQDSDGESGHVVEVCRFRLEQNRAVVGGAST